MAMNVGGSGGPKSDINITPLVDVVLVLLIIFMIITPIVQVGYSVQVPPKVETAAPVPQDSNQVIVRLDADGRPWINKQMMSMADFPAKLREVLTGRSSKVIFFAADGELEYDRVAQFMDICRDNGAQNLGIVFEDMSGSGAAAAGLGGGAAGTEN
ncbi:MAG TPA: biopolymer transporter ExbD [Thermoanaerobaculia bacterium]|nr:biopolymer transporter ExbD [Thermoanaerobaculia bacterium]